MFEAMFTILKWTSILLILVIIGFRIFAWYNKNKGNSKSKTVAFLHPFCAGGGGGEVVLWDAIAEMMQQRGEKLKFDKIIIYSANDDQNKKLSKVLKKVEKRFDIKISRENLKYLSLIPLSSYWIIKPGVFPFASLLLESLAAICLAFEGLFKFTPHIFIDTTGYAFTYPVASMLFGCTVISYTHYPTISTDMLHRVETGRIMYNNTGRFRQLRIIYYKLFAHLYGICGYFADIVMVNSTWTYNHINSIFYRSSSTSLDIVYPPCGNSQYLQEFDLKNRKKIILSVGQFRPEKDHNLQIEAFIKFRKKCKSKHPDAKLIMVGGCRGIEDKRRVTKLRVKINKYDLKQYIVIKENLEWSKLLKLFQDSFIGLHTMEDEHFGICLAEYMAAGLITIGHCSGGPLTDIVVNLQSNETVNLQQEEDGMKRTETGFLCTTVDQYAQCLEEVFDEYENGNGFSEMRERARRHCVDKFSTKLFQKEFINKIQSTFK